MEVYLFNGRFCEKFLKGIFVIQACRRGVELPKETSDPENLKKTSNTTYQFSFCVSGAISNSIPSFSEVKQSR